MPYSSNWLFGFPINKSKGHEYIERSAIRNPLTSNTRSPKVTKILVRPKRTPRLGPMHHCPLPLFPLASKPFRFPGRSLRAYDKAEHAVVQ